MARVLGGCRGDHVGFRLLMLRVQGLEFRVQSRCRVERVLGV